MPDGQTYHGPIPADLYDAELVIGRLNDAGRTLMALWVHGVRPAGYGSGMPEYGHDPEDLRDQMPDPDKIDQPNAREVTAMDDALAWLKHIPDSKVHWRRCVGYRMLTSPRNDKPCWSWKRMAVELRSEPKMCENAYNAGIDLIVVELNKPLISDALVRTRWG